MLATLSTCLNNTFHTVKYDLNVLCCTRNYFYEFLRQYFIRFVACAILVKKMYFHIDLQDQITGLKFLVFSDNFFGSMHSFLTRY
jgi:hypothetical protein